MKFRNALTVSAIALTTVLAGQAQAATATWDFDYTTVSGDTVNAVITTGNQVDPSNYPKDYNFSVASQNIVGGGGQGTYSGGITVAGYLITNVTGTRDGQAITGLYGTPGVIAYTPAGNYIFDNLLYVGTHGTVPFVDLGGVEFNIGSNYYNVYSNPANPTPATYFENVTQLRNLTVTFVGGTNPVGVSPVPLPAALPLFGAALAGLGFFGWRKKRSS